MGIFPDAQGQLTPQSLVQSDRISISFEMFNMVVLITCKNKEDPIKMKALEWSQDFPHYKPMGAICCYGNRVLIRSGPKPNAAFPPHPNDALLI